MVSDIQGYSEVRRTPIVTIRKIGYDDEVLIILVFAMFAGVLYAVISPVVERRKKMLLGGELSVVFVGLNKFIHYICNVG